MNNIAKILSVAVLAVGVGLGVGLGVSNPKASDVRVRMPLDSKARRVDGRLMCAVPVVLVDGGRGEELLEMVDAPCKRRPKGTPPGLCLKIDVVDGGSERRAPALEGFRFPSEQMVGVGCEPVACSIWFGDDPDAPEN